MTVRELIAKLSVYPPDMLTAVQCHYFDPLEAYEGILDGPQEFTIVPVCDVRTGYNPTRMGNVADKDADFSVLLIR